MSPFRPPVRPAAERNIASYAVDLAAALGARAAFTLTGGMAMYLNRAVSTHPGLTAVYNQHEQACAAGAEGYAKATDFRVAGLAVVTAGPGVTNTITSLCSAYGDSAPVIVLAGQVLVGRREALSIGVESAYPVAEGPQEVAAALGDPAGTLAARAQRIARTWSR